MYLLRKGQSAPKIDEFAFILLAGVILMVILMVAWTTPTEPVPIVDQTSFSLEIQKGESSTFKINIMGTKLSNVTLTASGEIRNWMTFNKNDFNIVESEYVTVTMKVPNSVSERLYTGKIRVESVGGDESISINVQVSKTGAILSSHAIVLGDFSVSYSVGPEAADSKKNVEITRGYFSGNEVGLSGELSEDKLETVTGGNIKLIVEDTNAAGNLIVVLNDEKIFDRKVNAGEVEIPIDKSKIKTSNTVTVSAGSPGWKFWMSTVYKFSSIEFFIDYKGIYSKEITFSLDEDQTEKFNNFHLNYRVRDYSSPLPEMLINVNSQLVYWKRPPLTFFNDTFEKDILGNELVLYTGENTISFSFEENAFYEVRNAVLTVYYSS